MTRPIKAVRAGWTDVILVCRKCSKKLDGGFGRHDERFAKALRRELSLAAGGGKTKTRKLKHAVVEVGCLDICPKGAVVVMSARRPADWLLVPAGTALGDVMRRLETPVAAE